MHAHFGKISSHIHALRRPAVTLTALCAAAVMMAGLAAPASAAESDTKAVSNAIQSGSPSQTADTATLRTWWHDNAEKNGSSAIADDTVRESPYYSTSVSQSGDEQTSYKSFTYISLPRSGNGKVGYTEQDGAEFAADSNLSMSWSTFEYSADAQVDVSLDTGQSITSVDQVTIRPTSDNFEKTLINDHTVRISVPYSDAGYRFSVEFEPQLFTSYNDNSGGSGALTTNPSSGMAVSTEPRNAMLVFAQPMLTGSKASEHIPDKDASNVKQISTGAVNDLDSIDANIDTLYFGPGTYWMGSQYRAQLPANIKWVYLAPGAYVKGAFKFLSDTASFKVTGYGVLSGEQYVYEADTENGYKHLDPNKSDCHSSCVKMLQFESSGTPQTLDLQGVTVANPPYHTFVMYGDEDGPFAMTVNNYQQIGGWYWQTDGLEMYKGSTLSNSFFHSNDDVIKLYHSNVTVNNNVIWKNENGPVFQWGWGPREVDKVSVADTDIIHNRMYWNDQKYNTCVFNSSSSYLDMGATNLADTTKTFQNMTFTNTNVEGMVNCVARIYSMQNTKNIRIDGLHVDAWNKLSVDAQQNFFKAFTDSTGKSVTIGNQTTENSGLLLHNYTVGNTSITKSGDNWASQELGRLNFDAALWDNWDATADDEPQGQAPELSVTGVTDGETAEQRKLPVSGESDAASVRISVNNGEDVPVTLGEGKFSTAITLPEVSNTVRITAVGSNGVMTVKRYTVYAFGSLTGSLSDPKGDDNGPGSYVYPSNGAFSKGSFDLRSFSIYRDGDTVRFVTTVDGAISNAWGGNGMSTQRLNIYLRAAAKANARSASTATAELPGTNTFTQGAWQKAIVVDGRNNGSRYESGVYNPGSAPEKSADVSVSVVQGNAIVASLPASSLAGIDLSKAGYQIAMFSSAEDSEGIGNVRPVYSKACWDGQESCGSFVQQYRFGGGLGVVADNAAHDSITTDSNAIDVFSGKQSQAKLMSLDKSQVVLPFLYLQDSDTPQPSDDPSSNGTGSGSGSHANAQSGSGQSDTAQSQVKTGVLARSGVSVGSILAVVLLLVIAAGISYRIRQLKHR